MAADVNKSSNRIDNKNIIICEFKNEFIENNKWITKKESIDCSYK